MAKKKIRKLLKGLGVGAALLGAGKALMNARDRKAMLNAADANEGFIDSMIPTAPFITRKGRDSILADPGINRITDYLPMKKGGRAKKGFAKKKKQANKMRKK